MDFAALISKEIAKAKSTDDKSSSGNKKYIRRSEAEAEREAAYRAEQAALEEKRAAKAAEKRRREEEEAEEAQIREDRRRRLADETRRRREEAAAAEERARRKRLGLPELAPAKEDGASEDGDGENDDNEHMSDEELTAKLRELGEPATLFGETRRARLKRYGRATTVVTAGPIPTTLRLVDEADMKVSAADGVPRDKEGRRYLFRQLASYFTMVLREWEAALAREQREQREQKEDDTTFASKAAVNAMVSSRAHMVPLFRKFESGDLDDDILRPVVEIVQAAQERRYVDANDATCA